MFVEDINISQESFEIMQPVIVFARLFGLFPIKYYKCGVQYKLQWSLGYGIYSCLLSAILTILTLLGVVSDLQKDETHSIRMKDKKGRYVTCCDISIVIVIVVFSLLTTPLKLKMFWRFLRYLNQIDTIIPIMGQKRHRRSSICFILAIFMMILVVLTFDISVWASNARKTQNTTHFFKNYFSFYLLYCILVMQEILFWHVIFFIKIRIALLNQTLKNLGSENLDKLYRKIFVQPYIDKSNFEPVSNDEKTKTENMIESVSSLNLVVRNIEKFSIVGKVLALIKVQEKLADAVESVNNCVAYGIHLILLSCLLHLIVTPYFLLTEIMKNGNVIFIALQSVWLVVHIGRVLIIVEPCQLCLNEHQKTSAIVCELLTCNFEEDEKKALTIFAMQLGYCKIRFTSCGFFKIDRSLLTTMAGAVTTYLVILFQFKN